MPSISVMFTFDFPLILEVLSAPKAAKVRGSISDAVTGKPVPHAGIGIWH